MGKRARCGGRSELARDLRAEARDSHNQAGWPGRAVPTQGPEPRRERARPSVAPGYQTPAAAAAAADAEFPEDWPQAESPVPADTAASPEVDADLAAAPWRCAAGLAPECEVEEAPAGAAAPPPEGRAADDGSPAAEAAADSESESSPRGSDQISALDHYERCAEIFRGAGDFEKVSRYEELAAKERACLAAAGEAAAEYAVSLSSEGLSTGGVGSNQNSPRSSIASPATPEAYHEDFERLEICSVEFGNHDGGADCSAHGAAASHGGASGASRTGARPAAAGDPPGLGRDLPGRPTGVGVDTRLLGKPHDFSGKLDDWRDWSVAFEGYAAAVVPGVEAGMTRAVEANAIVLNATLEAPVVRVSQQLYWMLLVLDAPHAVQEYRAADSRWGWERRGARSLEAASGAV